MHILHSGRPGRPDLGLSVSVRSSLEAKFLYLDIDEKLGIPSKLTAVLGFVPGDGVSRLYLWSFVVILLNNLRQMI